MKINYKTMINTNQVGKFDLLKILKVSKMGLTKSDLKTGVIVLVAVMVGLAVHQKFVAPRLVKKA